ncbi:Sphingosine N-acyltransferase lac1 [Taphrina deformans PYCC 5710]|uniref:Sphingosine N-acyltransferase lac1 n=1 Tax=Taphrina deformans (strain PYCC 5710 / ATCC 11124 / CBS 356.35 / IMI 108563 / JCM 9778 / NBRC 8474) TaxID=1097556 RepID=R4X850_TAPDE|nr:Sphingosine N-acyltransferase lac1 [Taphrina deformans PYCC 5710]|eukprot:CCG81658.1 Sphingosine N-acyltransferase lac1 [Taphrina deformans PYCC 5710]
MATKPATLSPDSAKLSSQTIDRRDRPGGLSPQPGRLPRPKGSRRSSGIIDRYVHYSKQNTWLNPLIIIVLVLGLYLIDPTPSNPVSHAIFVSYPIKGTNPTYYAKGRLDGLFMAFYVVVFTFTREFCMQWILAPIARKFGLASGKAQRFMEQGYTIMYFTCSASYGIWVMSHTNMWYFNTTEFYADYPHKYHLANFKMYYLCQFAYWLQQFIVLALQLEKPRKDYHELVAHHIVTLLLIGLSYRFHFTYIGLCVFITMDSSDIWLALSKNLNYVDSSLTGPVFAAFIVIWFYTRHYLSLIILWSVATEFRTVGPWYLDWDTEHYKCWISQYVCFALLAAIQLLNAYWSFLILRIAYRFVVEDVAKDDRSDDEEEDDSSNEKKVLSGKKKQ